ncbi:MAG: hypothetical protein H0W50_03410 [Parachlamydiaceae bacterium]|nr:hypothetical protein [Parachlamydiaceae bacterium]
MQIKIAERFRPFVHIPGVQCVLPFTTLCFQIYPAFIRVFDLSTSTPIPSMIAEFPLSIQGPVHGFTVQQDLEKGHLKVWGDSAQGFFRYRIESKSGSKSKFKSETDCSKEFVLISEKMPEVLPKAYCGISAGVTCCESAEPNAIERLSFGVTKKADWVLVSRRIILAEILPFWFRLGQMIPAVLPHSSGSAVLFDHIQEALTQQNSLGLASALRHLFFVGFEGLLSPTLIDSMHQGFSLPTDQIESAHSPLLLLTKGAQMIKQMLAAVNNCAEDNANAAVDILPCLLPELHAGRYCDVQLGSIGKLDLEWTKKQTRRIIFHSAKEQTLTFNFQKDLKSFRLRNAVTPVASLKTCGKPIVFATGTYFLDNFER